MEYKKALEILEILKKRDTPSDKETAIKPGIQPADAETGQETPARIAEIEAEVTEVPAGNKDGVEGNLKESAVDDAAPDSVLLPTRKAASELEPKKVNLAAATVRPLSLLGTKKSWVWTVVVLVCIALVGYLLYKWYKEKRESTSPPKQEPQSIKEFTNKRYPNASDPS